MVGVFIRWVVRKTATSLIGHELTAFTDGDYVTEANQTNDPVSVLRLQIRYSVIRGGLQPDVFENVLHFVNTSGELPGAQATDAQKAAVEAAFSAFYANAKSYVPNNTGLSEYRWYHFTFDDPLTGPPTRVTTLTRSPGSLSTVTPAQVATSITLRTALRRHWGRIYLPGAKIDATDALTASTDCDYLCNSFRTFMNACASSGLTPVVYSKTKQAVFSLMAVEVDNVPDVVRRRRPKASTYRKIVSTAT